MSQQVYRLSLMITEEEIKSFFENEVLKNRIQELKNSEEYKKLPKVLDDPILKVANNIGPEDMKRYLKELETKFEEILFRNVALNAINNALSKFISSSGKIDIIEEIKEEISIDLMINTNNATIATVSSQVKIDLFMNSKTAGKLYEFHKETTSEDN